MSGQPTDPVLFVVGDMQVTQHWVITPSGTTPISGTSWHVADLTSTTTAIPTWAIVMCVLTVWMCGLGLLFLLAKEQRTTGQYQVTVTGPGLHHACYLPITSEQQVHGLRQAVAHAQALAAA